MNRKFTWDEYDNQITVAESLRRAEMPEYHKALPGKENLVYGEYNDGVEAFNERMESSEMTESDEVVEWVEVENDVSDIQGDPTFEEQFEAQIAQMDADELRELRDDITTEFVEPSDITGDDGDQKVLTR